jgi:NTP pyrophosphatase (non-canonical NTP hydrolase)
VSADARPSLESLASRLAEFAREREWEAFHSPKNLAMALAGEAGELIEHFQWLTESQSHHLSDERREAVALEMADVLLYLVRLADQLHIDLLDAAARKIELNARTYLAERFRGSARKYDE